MGDLWADVVIGKPKFTEAGPNTIVATKLFGSRGVTVDRTGSYQKPYVWDGSNSRILGFDWDKCLLSNTKPMGCSADMVIGQPDMNSSACNGDSAFQNYPQRASASAASLCGMPENALSPAEGGSATFDEDDNLYVGDANQGRLLIYKGPLFVSDPPPPDTEDPTISITSPASGTTVSGTIDVAAGASDNVGVTKVEFYVGGVLKSTDTSSPYSYGWDTTTASNGNHTLLARAYDASGNTGTDSVSVTVDNPPDGIQGDLDGDSRVDVADLSILLSNWT